MKAYLCCPYSHESEQVRERRFDAANRAAAGLIEKGYNVFSPISHSHPIAKHIGNNNDSVFWVDMDLEWMRFAEIVFVLMMDGWDQSDGIKKEVLFATQNDIPVQYLHVIQ